MAAIDVGSNAVRLKVAICKASEELRIIDRRRELLPLGERVFERGGLDSESTEGLIRVLSAYHERCRGLRAKVRAVATSALREAENRAEVVAEVERRTGITIELISGEEEARLVCLGVLWGTAAGIPSVCLDIGGGSTEVVIARGAEPMALHSAKIGSIRLTRQAASEGLSAMREAAHWAAQALPNGPLPTDRAIGCSGMLRAVIDFAAVDAPLIRSELTMAIDRLARLGASGRRALFGEPRSQTVLAGAVILEAVMERLGIVAVSATKRGLRDGVLFDVLQKEQGRLGRAALAERIGRRP